MMRSNAEKSKLKIKKHGFESEGPAKDVKAVLIINWLFTIALVMLLLLGCCMVNSGACASLQLLLCLILRAI